MSGCDRHPTDFAGTDEAIVVVAHCDSSPQEAVEGFCEFESGLEHGVRPCLGEEKKNPKCLWNKWYQLPTPISHS